MAESFNISGPCAVQTDLVLADTLVTLGRTDNDDLVAVEYDTRNEIIEANDTGRVPGEIVFVGAIAVVTCTLIKWDTAQADDLRDAALGVRPSGSEGVIGAIGSLWIGDSKCFKVRIEPDTAGKTYYEFQRCYLDGPGSVREFDFGNKGRRLAIQFIAIPNGSDVLYTTGTVSA